MITIRDSIVNLFIFSYSSILQRTFIFILILCSVKIYDDNIKKVNINYQNLLKSTLLLCIIFQI